MITTLAIPRPDADEHVEYYGRYIARVPGDDALVALTSHIEQWTPALQRITDAQGMHRYAPGKWSVKEVLNHIADGERVFCYRALRFARADQTPLPGFDENAWAPAMTSDRRPIAEVVEELRAVRAATVSLFRSFEPAMLTRRGLANDNAISVRALAWIIAGHAMHHQAGLRDNYGIGG